MKEYWECGLWSEKSIVLSLSKKVYKEKREVEIFPSSLFEFTICDNSDQAS